jgi:hypothetical protein
VEDNISVIELHSADLRVLKNQTEDLQQMKLAKVDFEEGVRKLGDLIRELRNDTDNHGNHFAMVENFIEKYIPIRIQSTISEVLTSVLGYDERTRLAEFDKKKFMELHQVILDDEGTPNLVEQLKLIKMQMEDKPYKSKKKMMALFKNKNYGGGEQAE